MDLAVRVTHPILAHQVELSGEVGATLHVEPNDNPRAGEPSVTWFALVTQGGQPVPLAACNCELAVYALPRQSGDSPVAEPPLTPLSAEGYQSIPSAVITFPTVGEYELLLMGSSMGDPAFEPFELSFDVLVARGTQVKDSQAETEAAPTETNAADSAASTTNRPVDTTANTAGNNGMGTVMIILILSAVIGSIAYLTFRNRL